MIISDFIVGDEKTCSASVLIVCEKGTKNISPKVTIHNNEIAGKKSVGTSCAVDTHQANLITPEHLLLIINGMNDR